MKRGFVIAAMMACWSCGEESSPAPDSGLPEAYAEVPAEGLGLDVQPEVVAWSQTFTQGVAGTLEVTDPASPIYGFRLDVDPDSLSTQTLTVTVAAAAAPLLPGAAGPTVGPAVSIQPHGYEFAHPVRLALPLAFDAQTDPVSGWALLAVARAEMPGEEAQAVGAPLPVLRIQDVLVAEPSLEAGAGPVAVHAAKPDGTTPVERVLVLTSGLSEWIPLIQILPDACKTAADCWDYRFCTLDQCVGGKCKWTEKGEGEPCNDGDPYTVGETCQGGYCKGAQASCALDSDCVNAPNCHGGWCVEHDCVYDIWPKGTPCDDKQVCTVDDQCSGTMSCGGSPKSCDDGEVCTQDVCEEGEGDGCFHDPVAGATPCDDGNPDTVGDTCSGGKCVGEPKECAKDLDCDDKNACTTQTCDGGFCKASSVQDGAPCDDGDPATTPDKCIAGQCVGYWDECTKDADCDDKEVCTLDTCETGACFHGPVPGNPPCNDADPMTIDDECSGGWCGGWNAECTATELFNCDDLSPCTIESCAVKPGDLGGKCAKQNISGPACNDGNPDTNQDLCEDGQCVGHVVACVSDDECSDSIPCTKDTCIDPTAPDGGVCVHDDGAAACEDNNPCTKDECKPLGCEHDNLTGVECSDGNDWTDQDTCVDGVCKGIPVKCTEKAHCDNSNMCAPQDCIGGLCTASLDTDGLVCDETNPCLTRLCSAGKCALDEPKNGIACSDGNPANDPDQCWFGACIGTAGGCQENGQCPDQNVCTEDLCEAAKCVHKPLSGGECEDLDPNTIDEACVDGVCKGKPPECFSDNPTACDDGNSCTADSCEVKPGNAGGKCAHVPLSETACDDGDKLTVDDMCQSGVCQGFKVDCVDLSDCDDKNPCTQDDCVKEGGAAGGKCTYVDVGATVCDDKDPCTEDTCFADKCTHQVVDGVACDDGNPATTGDTCTNGVCSGKAKACTKVGSNFIECSDGKLCTDDVCTAALVCTNTPGNFPSCDDGDPNTTGDKCTAGVCAGTSKTCGNPADCDDGNSCTTDQCTGGKCAWTPLHGIMCNDGSPTTFADMCYFGKCVGGGTCTKPGPCGETLFKKCSPFQCTNGLCLWFPVDGEACDDQDPCTESDQCTNGVCKGKPVSGCSVPTCRCGEPGVTLTGIDCKWDNCLDCSGWAGQCGALALDPYAPFADGAKCVDKSGSGIEINCP
jgi:hypothetical protein